MAMSVTLEGKVHIGVLMRHIMSGQHSRLDYILYQGTVSQCETKIVMQAQENNQTYLSPKGSWVPSLQSGNLMYVMGYMHH